MTIDKYTKFILTLIAVGVLGLNFHLLNGSLTKDAYADNNFVIIDADHLTPHNVFVIELTARTSG